tara:strand:- start:685 stop:915 length:231 start_codon:yes stop_codon:yes gene_type:complete
MDSKSQEKKSHTQAFRFRAEFKEMLSDAARVTGITQTAIIEECVEAHIDEIIRREESSFDVVKERLKNQRKSSKKS